MSDGSEDSTSDTRDRLMELMVIGLSKSKIHAILELLSILELCSDDHSMEELALRISEFPHLMNDFPFFGSYVALIIEQSVNVRNAGNISVGNINAEQAA